MVITTNFKNKLPKGLSYPIGTQCLAGHLEDLSKIEDPFLCYSFFSDRLAELKSKNVPFVILEVRFSPPQQQYFGSPWEIHVYAVKSEQRSAAKEGLESVGLPQVKAWLNTDRPESWSYSRQSIECLFDPNELSVSVCEQSH